MEMLYLESKDNKISELAGVKKVKQTFNLPVMNKSYSWYFYFPKNVPEGYCLYHLSSQYLARVAKFRKPCIVTHMDLAPVLFPKECPFITGFLLKRALQFYEKMERIITISDSEKKELVEYCLAPADKIDVVVPGYNERIFSQMDKEKARKKLGLPQEKKIILNIGSEEPRKNIPCLLEAYKSIEKDLVKTMLVRIGNRNPQYDSKKKGLNILELNKIPEKQLALYYNAADLFVFPATYEGGFAYPPLEAMACGTPTIVGNELQLMKEGALIADVSNPEAVAEAAKKILANPAEAKKRSGRAVAAAKRFTLTEEVKKTVIVYKKTLGG